MLKLTPPSNKRLLLSLSIKCLIYIKCPLEPLKGNFTVYRTVVSTPGITKYIRHQNIIKERETDHVIAH